MRRVAACETEGAGVFARDAIDRIGVRAGAFVAALGIMLARNSGPSTMGMKAASGKSTPRFCLGSNRRAEVAKQSSASY
jgi:hypothetical protein